MDRALRALRELAEGARTVGEDAATIVRRMRDERAGQLARR